jgi:hypothetical protein
LWPVFRKSEEHRALSCAASPHDNGSIRRFEQRAIFRGFNKGNIEESRVAFRSYVAQSVVPQRFDMVHGRKLDHCRMLKESTRDAPQELWEF